MKYIIALGLLTSMSAFAQVPNELRSLIPVGGNSIQLRGTTEDHHDCTVNLSSSQDTFSADVAVLDANGDVNSRRFGTFQIGFGHKLQKISQQGANLVAVSAHQAEEQYASDSLSILKVNKTATKINAILIEVQEKGFFGYKTEVKEACFFK